MFKLLIFCNTPWFFLDFASNRSISSTRIFMKQNTKNDRFHYQYLAFTANI